VIRIENSSLDRRYPHTVYALVFELNTMLWFYTDADGTQSLSRYRGRVEADKADFGSLLPFIDPGFVRWTPVPEGVGEVRTVRRPPHACFIESIALLHRRIAEGGEVKDARLLSYYVEIGGELRGHTVLQYRSAGAVRVVDPNRPMHVIRIGPRCADDPVAVARSLRNDVVRARAVPLDEIVQQAPSIFAVAEPSVPRSSPR
jgi:hypothetical protein